jgi:hypothetical protein
MTDDPELPLWAATAARERRAGLKPIAQPPVQKRPVRPKVKRKKRTPEPVYSASVSAIPHWRNRPLMQAWTDELLELEPGPKRAKRLDRDLERLADERRKFGLSEGWIIAERSGIRRALNEIVRERYGRGPEGGAA